jgi:putative DNA primase/helicase
MKPIDVIREVKLKANGQWQTILSNLGAEVPLNKHTACPHCGGKDRFRFDDKDGNGTFICNQCGSGDGLDLVQRVLGVSVTEAAKEVAGMIGIDTHSECPPAYCIHEVKVQQDVLRAQQAENKANEQIEKHKRFTERYSRAIANAKQGESDYLKAKGFESATVTLLADGSLIIPLVDTDGTITAAQTINPNGEKRLLLDSAKNGSYYPINEPVSISTVIIAEGLATAMTCHLLNPEAYAVAAIDAGNLIHVAKAMRTKYPESQIIIAGDNDIKPDQPNTGKLAAEKAAKAVNGIAVLPPTDDKADWDDYRLSHGIEAAKQVFSAELAQQEGNVVKKDNVIRIDAKKKIKTHDDLGPFFDKRHGGLYYIERKQNNTTGDIDEKETWFSDEMETVGIGSDGKDSYLVIQMRQEGSNRIIYEAIPRRELGSPQGWGRLRSRGVNITTKRGQLDLLANYLQRKGKRDEWTITHTAGWHDGAYVMPDGHIIGTSSRPVAFCGGTSAVAGYIVRGTTESWRKNVGNLMKGNQSMILGGLVALAAPLNSLSGGSSFGIHLFAQSSAGKTTTVEAASSIYGVPDELKLTWDATKYGLTIEAASRNDGFMPIDEIGQGNDVRHVAGSAYSLFNGTGRIQGNKDGGNKAILRWAIVALSTGEEDFETYLIRNGVTPKAGQLVRLVSVPFTDTVEFHSLDDGDLHSRAIKRASTRHCGAVGRAWIEYLANNQDAANQKVTFKEHEWLSSLPEDASSQVKRVATRFAMLDATAELSTSITGWDVAECSRFIRNSFNEWLENYGTGNREKYQVVKRARDFIQRYGLTRFQPYTYGKRNGDLDRTYAGRMTNLAGYLVSGRREDGKNEYHIIPSVFEDEILSGIQKKLGAEALDEVGILVRPESGRVDGKTISINGSQQRFVVLIDSEEE